MKNDELYIRALVASDEAAAAGFTGTAEALLELARLHAPTGAERQAHRGMTASPSLIVHQN